LEEWEADAEAFALEDASTAWDSMPRPCAESLFKSLMIERRGVLVPVLMGMLSEV
jgi:hypothetical protein